MNGAIRCILDDSWTDCYYHGGMIRGEISRGIDLNVSWRDIFSYEEIKEIGYFVCVGGPVCGFVCGKVIEVVGYYAVEEVFASYCNQSAAPLGVFGVVVSSSYESIAQDVQEAVKVFFGDGVSGRVVYSWSGDCTMTVFYCYVCCLEVVFLEWWKFVVLNVWFDYDSGAAVGLSAGVLGVVEVVAVYFKLVFVGEVGFGHEHHIDLLLF